MKQLRDYITSIPDFPEIGIIFRDITTVLQDPHGFHLAIDTMYEQMLGIDFDVLVGTESRGFIFGTPLAYKCYKPFVLARKPGKLPRETIREVYDLEYGHAILEMHKDSIQPGQKVIIVDDLLATGGTAQAAANLVEKLGGQVVQMNFLIELPDLKGRENLRKYRIESAVKFDGK